MTLIKKSIEQPYGWIVALASLLLMAIGAGGYFIVIVGLKLIAQDFGGGDPAGRDRREEQQPL